MRLVGADGRVYGTPEEVKALLAKQRREDAEALSRLEGQMIGVAALYERPEWASFFAPALQASILARQVELEQIGLAEARSNALRGEIAALRHVLALPAELARRVAEKKRIAEDRAGKDPEGTLEQ